MNTRYDPAQNPISKTYNNGYVVHKTWDNTNKLSSLRYDNHDIASYQYNADNQLLQQALYNGIDLHLSYDSSARETSRDYSNVYRQQTSYDSNSNILQDTIQFNNQQLVKSYAYDAQNRLTEDNAQQQYFQYDLNGNITATNHNGYDELRQLNGDDQYTDITNNSIAYDLNGNISHYQNKTYHYDFANRLVHVEHNNQTLATYSYDAENRRVSKSINGQITTYLYSHNQVVQEYSNNPTADISYLYADNIDDPVAFIKNQQRYYYIKDRLNSVRAITNEQGHIVETYHYSAFGLMTIYDAQGNSIAQSALGNPYTYTGRRYDNETGLYYYRNRMYSAELGRFISEDPLGYEDGFNLYAYAKNNPLKYVDPLGTTAMLAGSGFPSNGGCYSVCAPSYNIDSNALNYGSNIDTGSSFGLDVNDFGSGVYASGANVVSGSVDAQEDTRTWGSYLPGVEAGDSAARHWADQLVAAGGSFTDDPVASTGLFLSVLWTEETATTTGVTLGTAGVGSLVKSAAGPLKQWIRIGPSYSKAAEESINLSVRWGASPAGGGRYIQQIPSPTLQRFNQWLRGLQLPGNGWRTKDAGHLHIKK